jgi:hypothetical protein
MIGELFAHLFSSRGSPPVTARSVTEGAHAALGDCWPHVIVGPHGISFRHEGKCKLADISGSVGKIPDLPQGQA